MEDPRHALDPDEARANDDLRAENRFLTDQGKKTTLLDVTVATPTFSLSSLCSARLSALPPALPLTTPPLICTLMGAMQ
jgi:hypothetical protein